MNLICQYVFFNCFKNIQAVLSVNVVVGLDSIHQSALNDQESPDIQHMGRSERANRRQPGPRALFAYGAAVPAASRTTFKTMGWSLLASNCAANGEDRGQNPLHLARLFLREPAIAGLNSKAR